mmetsp:Transcript_32795/g.59889  ORF Transcript_32795/g.59889 Transcript_32795/m.59889 type:complete len:113 (-) Transcript_32795:113-451(-)
MLFAPRAGPGNGLRPSVMPSLCPLPLQEAHRDGGPLAGLCPCSILGLNAYAAQESQREADAEDCRMEADAEDCRNADIELWGGKADILELRLLEGMLGEAAAGREDIKTAAI